MDDPIKNNQRHLTGVKVIRKWFDDNVHFPYPDRKTKQQLAAQSNKTALQLAKTFTAMRKRAGIVGAIVPKWSHKHQGKHGLAVAGSSTNTAVTSGTFQPSEIRIIDDYIAANGYNVAFSGEAFAEMAAVLNRTNGSVAFWLYRLEEKLKLAECGIRRKGLPFLRDWLRRDKTECFPDRQTLQYLAALAKCTETQVYYWMLHQNYFENDKK